MANQNTPAPKTTQTAPSVEPAVETPSTVKADEVKRKLERAKRLIKTGIVTYYDECKLIDGKPTLTPQAASLIASSLDMACDVFRNCSTLIRQRAAK